MLAKKRANEDDLVEKKRRGDQHENAQRRTTCSQSSELGRQADGAEENQQKDVSNLQVKPRFQVPKISEAPHHDAT